MFKFFFEGVGFHLSVFVSRVGKKKKRRRRRRKEKRKIKSKRKRRREVKRK
jgi:hypothetical protein